MQLHLANTTHTLELSTSVAGSVHYQCGYTDIAAAAIGNPATNEGIITTAATTAIIAAPAAATTRKVQYINVYNNGATNTIKLIKDISATEYTLLQVVLQNGETLRIINDVVTVLDASGRLKQQNLEQSNLTGLPVAFLKVGTAPKAAGAYYSFFKDSGTPGAWALATPGLNGVNIDGSSATFAGLFGFQNPGSGAMYLRDANLSASVACGLRIWDLLWYNTGFTITTTTAQAITQPTLPARDINGTTNGEGVYAALYISATLGNAAVSNTTLQYTNSAGVAGRTATIVSVTAAASIGQMFIFQLQAGDTGIRSTQSLTLGTSYVSGTVNLFLYRQVASIAALAINSGASASSQQSKNLDLRLYNGTALAVIQLASATTATNVDGEFYLVNK
jgi:hypothetical protein